MHLLRRLGLLLALLFVGASCSRPSTAGNPRPNRPNVLWILGDDLGPDLACYGNDAVRTPNLDRLAASGVRFTRAFTTAPVCSPSRSAWNTGMYQIAIDAQNHRSHRGDGFRLPDGVKLVSHRFHEAGYFTANVTTAAPGVRASGKTDFNFTVEKPFDGTDWSQRAPGQPFYAQVNFMEPHRGPAWPQARKQPELVDPAKVKLPPYYPDDGPTRDDYANYLDAVHLLDTKVGAVLKRLDDEGLADNTLVFFFGDNGRCHVRDKQWLYEGGLHVPLIVRWPRGPWKPGTVENGMVSAIDISATSLALAGIKRPAGLDGQPFLGRAAKTRKEIFGARDRCDETVDRIRSVRTERYKLIRNYYPDRPYAQTNAYKERQYPILNRMKQLHTEGKLTPEQSLFFAPHRPAEELYDLRNDPHEVRNLAGLTEHRATLAELRGKLDGWIAATRDRGATPEGPAVIERMK
jgi:arylsulfatase A-like enzyme